MLVAVNYPGVIGLLIMVMLSGATLAQHTVSGRVYDAANLQPLGNVTITSSATDQGTASDKDGSFQWTLYNLSDTLIFNHLGYEIQQVILTSDSRDLHILLRSKAFQLPGIMVSGTARSQQLLEVPGAISLISNSELQRDNQTNIAEPLNRIPGLYMHSGTLNTNRITIRGIGSRSLFSTTKIRAYLNDIPLTTGDGETTLEDIDLSLIDRVEVIKGPSSSIYGAGLGGTINMKASKAAYATTSLSNELTLGSFGLIRNVSNLNLGRDKLNLKINFNTTHQDGYRQNNEYDRKSFNILTQLYPAKNSSLTLLASWVDLLAFIPSSLNYEDFKQNPTKAAFTWAQSMGFEDYQKGLLGLNYLQALSASWDFSVSLFGNFRNSYELRPFNILDENTSALGARVKSTKDIAIAQGELQWIVGGEFFNEHYQWLTLENLDRMEGSLLSDNDETRRYGNLFTELNWSPTPNTLVSAGLNFNSTSYDYEDLFLGDGEDLSGKYSFENQWSPRLALNHKFNETQSLYAQVSHGFSPPGLSETLTPDGAINPNIQPETGYNFELGTRGKLKKTPLWWDISLYSMYIRNLLVARRTGDDIFVGVNAGKTTHRGLDLSINYDINTNGTMIHLWSTYGFADYVFKEFIDEEMDFSGNELTGTPKHKFNIGVDLELECGIYGNMNILHVGAMPLRDDNSLYSDSYTLLNVKLGFQKTVAQKVNLKLYAAINNLWDEHYASMLLVNASSFGGNAPRYYYPGLPRNYFGGVSVTYKFN